MTRVIGVDPGARSTGVVVIDTLEEIRQGVPMRLHGETVHHGAASQLKPRPAQLAPTYLAAVIDAVDAAIEVALRQAVAGPTFGGKAPHALLAIEGVVPPHPHHAEGRTPRITNVAALLATAQLAGALVARYYARGNVPVDVVLVRPGGNGSRPWGTYPHNLVSESERRAIRKIGEGAWRGAPAGDGILRHERSAYDVARKARAAWSIARHGDGLHGWSA